MRKHGLKFENKDDEKTLKSIKEKEVKSIGFALRTSQGDKCSSSPVGKHIAVSDGKHCVYCGEEVKNVGMVLRSSRSDLCYSSPNKKHAIDK